MFKPAVIIGLVAGATALLAASLPTDPHQSGAAFVDVGSSTGEQSREPLAVSKLPAFRFVDQTNEPFARENLLGELTLVHFFFSTCNGPCPGVTSALSPLLKEFPALRIVSISIDPAHDTPEVLRQYAERLAAPERRWLFLHGNQAQVLSLAQFGFGFGIDAESKIHSTSAVLFDRAGSALGSFKPLERASLTELKELLKRQ